LRVTPPHFRDFLAEPGCLIVPAVYDALSARIAARVGFRAVGLGGFLVAASRLGGPDVGQLTMTEMVEHVRGVAGAVAIPVAEHQRKIEAALDARRDPRTVIIARTDARGPLGFEEAIRRAHAYVKAGADGIFLEALESPDEVRRAPQALPGVPLVANVFTMGKSPLFTAAELAAMGYRIGLWVVDALWAAARAVEEVLTVLHRDGHTSAARDRLMAFDDYFALVGLAEYERLERRYAE
jgi:methylisocitrate lyase